MRLRLIATGLGLAVAVGWPAAVRADVIHLRNGSEIPVEAWRDAGDAVEFMRGGGIVRIAKSEIRKIDGRPVRGELRMYASGETAAAPAGEPAAPAARADATRRLGELLKQGDALFSQTALTNTEKATAFRRLGEQWREVDVPDALRSAHERGQQALQLAFEAYQAEGALPADPSQRVADRLARARAGLAEAQDEMKKLQGQPKQAQPSG